MTREQENQARDQENLHRYYTERARNEAREARIKDLDSRGSFDWAMPQDWFERASYHTGENPSGQVVWFYPSEYRLAPYPAAVTPEGEAILGKLAAMAGFRIPRPDEPTSKLGTRGATL